MDRYFLLPLVMGFLLLSLSALLGVFYKDNFLIVALLSYSGLLFAFSFVIVWLNDVDGKHEKQKIRSK
jgi:hypothetical protein